MADIRALAGALSCALLAGCGGGAVVMPYDDGHFESTAQASSRQAAMQAALAEAKAECASRHRGYVVSDSVTRWTGSGDEQAHRAVSAMGEIVAGPGAAEAYGIDTDEDYTATVEFRCK